MAAPTQNENARKHGLYSGSIGRGNGWIRRACATFQVALEAAVIDARGEVNIRDAAAIQTAIRWERHAQLAQKWLRLNPELEVEKKLHFSREVARASSERDKALDALRLPAGRGSHWDGIFDGEATPTAPQIAPTEEQHPANNGKSRKSSSQQPTPQPVPEASPSTGLAVPNAPESSLASADANPTTDTSRPDCASEATSGATTIDASPEETDRW